MNLASDIQRSIFLLSQATDGVCVVILTMTLDPHNASLHATV